jgi:hypothetical protein
VEFTEWDTRLAAYAVIVDDQRRLLLIWYNGPRLCCANAPTAVSASDGSITARMKMRLRNHCQEDHQSWPAKGRYIRPTAEAGRRRMHACAADSHAVYSLRHQTQSPRLGLVDLDTGEINDF